jgi:hypothetical protein
MIRLVLIGIALAATALTAYVAKCQFSRILTEPFNVDDPPPNRPTTRKARNRRQPIHPSDNGDTLIPLP